jgi:hypothetical protein
MNTNHPEGLSQEIIDVAMPVRDELVRAGWTFGVIHWDNEPERKLGFSAKSPSGRAIFVACHECDLAKKLRELWDPSRY